MAKKKQIQTNEFFDINKFPASEGMLVFGISMNLISNSQNATRCFNYVKELVKKMEYPYIGLTFLYSDNLYLYQKANAAELNKKHQKLILDHKNGFKKILDKNKWYIRDSFSFISWNQAILESKNFTNYLGQIKKLYAKDSQFQKYVKEDIKNMNRKITKLNILFILEELLIFYLVSKGEIKFSNKFLNGKEKWVLWCYPGPPLKSEIYLFKKNIFQLKNTKNVYENCYYDLKAKKLYDYNKVNLSSIKLK